MDGKFSYEEKKMIQSGLILVGVFCFICFRHRVMIVLTDINLLH